MIFCHDCTLTKCVIIVSNGGNGHLSWLYSYWLCWSNEWRRQWLFVLIILLPTLLVQWVREAIVIFLDNILTDCVCTMSERGFSHLPRIILTDYVVAVKEAISCLNCTLQMCWYSEWRRQWLFILTVLLLTVLVQRVKESVVICLNSTLTDYKCTVIDREDSHLAWMHPYWLCSCTEKDHSLTELYFHWLCWYNEWRRQW